MSVNATSTSPLSAVSRIGSEIHSQSILDADKALKTKTPGDKATRDAFQEFVAGTFFQQMFKSLRETQEKPKYFNGGQAEEIFQSQLDQQLSTDLARKHGGALAGSLYDPFVQNVRPRSVAASASAS
ncbi:MAG: rod-binding protein [Planctomycetaceae bacterium]|nr:rod-binding protein [Planctomycetaceae bacterium]